MSENTIHEFWIVVRDLSEMRATYRHPSLVSAKEEASRLAGMNGDRFFVMHCLGACVPATPPTEWVDATAATEITSLKEEDLPF